MFWYHLGLTTAASATDAAIQNKIFGSGMTASIISNEENEDIMKIVISFEESGLLIKGTNETIKIEAKEQKARFLRMLLGNMLAGKTKNIWSRSNKSKGRSY